MILADKIIRLRKKANWSQEEFASQMNVSRQAVSKWEQAQSIPDLDKILLMADLFGVSTDYLLKDEKELEEYSSSCLSDYPYKRVSIQLANRFLDIKKEIGFWVAIGVSLCILSPIVLIVLSDVGELVPTHLSEQVISVIGVSTILIMVCIAVALFILKGSLPEEFLFIEKEEIELEYGVLSMVKQRKQQFQSTYTKYNLLGVLLCILSILPVLFSSLLSKEEHHVFGVALLLVFVSIGVFFFIYVGYPWGAYKQLLQEGEYSKTNKLKEETNGVIASIYWPIVVAIYLFMSFTNNNWNHTWVIWPIAGVLFGAVTVVVGLIIDHRK